MTGFVKTTKDFGDATAEIVRRGWPLHIWNHLKNWDSTWLDTVMKDGDLLDIGCRYSSVPNAVGINDHRWAMFALIEAARLIRPYSSLQSALDQLPLE